MLPFDYSYQGERDAEIELAGGRRRKVRRRAPIPIAEAISRLDLTLEALERETRAAIWAKSTLEAGNKIVIEKYHNRNFKGAHCYNVIRSCTEISLILSLCKLLEMPRIRTRQSQVAAFNLSDLASIPVFLHLLGQKRCRTRLAARASRGWDGNSLGMSKTWERDCWAALERCDEAGSRLKSAEGLHATATLRKFRDDHVAHLYAKQRPWDANRYAELYALLDIAEDLISHASIALRGCNLDLAETTQFAIEEAQAFWTPALAAAIKADPDAV